MIGSSWVVKEKTFWLACLPFFRQTSLKSAFPTFSEEAVDFSEEMLEVVQQKVHICPKSYKSTFSEQALESRTFSEQALDFSEHEIGIVGNFVLIPFRANDGNPTMLLQIMQLYAPFLHCKTMLPLPFLEDLSLNVY